MEIQNINVENDDENGFKVEFCGDDFRKAAEDASAIVLATEWDQFKQIDLVKLRQIMNV